MTRLGGLDGDATAASPVPLVPIPAPPFPDAIPLAHEPDAVERPDESWLLLNGQATVRNVSVPTLTPFLPTPGTATGAAMIVAPGGGFVVASMENEGWPVARWLAERGIAAFVLKYRLEPTPAPMEEFRAAMVRRFMTAVTQDGRRRLPVPAAAAADARAALRLVRERAGEWVVDRKRIGFIGFSAGAMTGLETARGDSSEPAPDLLATIYPSMESVPVSADAPPLFVAMAADDPLFGRQGYDLAAAWRAADRPVELHVYQNGGHGFGMGRLGTTSMGWMETFAAWLSLHGWTGGPEFA